MSIDWFSIAWADHTLCLLQRGRENKELPTVKLERVRIESWCGHQVTKNKAQSTLWPVFSTITSPYMVLVRSNVSCTRTTVLAKIITAPLYRYDMYMPPWKHTVEIMFWMFIHTVPYFEVDHRTPSHHRVLVSHCRAHVLSRLVFCNANFGIQNNIDTLQDIVEVVTKSASLNHAELTGTQPGETRISIHDWSSFFRPHFCNLARIKDLHHSAIHVCSDGSRPADIRVWVRTTFQHHCLWCGILHGVQLAAKSTVS